MDEARGVVDVAVIQGEDLTWAHGCLADREDHALEDQPVAVGAARAGPPTQPLILLVADHFEVGPVDPACALADPQARKDVSRNQVTVERVVEELPRGLLDMGPAGQRPAQRLPRV
jgi:hypothetical protein